MEIKADDKKSPQYLQLMKTVVEYSQNSSIEIAKKEWYIIAGYREKNCITCICGQKNCIDVYIIKNYYNNNILPPIGSSCMRHFDWSDQEKTILEAYEKWNYKKYNEPTSVYYKVEFNEIIKDVEYIRSLERFAITAEHRRLLQYAHSVWVHNPPPLKPIYKNFIEEVNPPPLKPKCEKCIQQVKKGYKKCYECFTQESPKSKCLKCEEQKKKGFLLCYNCYVDKKSS